MNRVSEEKEHGIVLLKPDGVKRGIYDLLVRRIAENGLQVVRTKTLKLERRDVLTRIVTKFDVEAYAEYMSKSEVIALLVRGPYAIARLIEIKQRIRGEYGLSGNDMENLIHSPDCGNEYYEHFQYLFPELDCVKYGQYADLNVKAGGVDGDVGEALRNLNERSSLHWAGVLFDYGADLTAIEGCKALANDRIRVLIGIAKSCVFRNERLGLIGYLPPDHSFAADPFFPVEDDAAESFVNWVKSKKGVCVMDYRPFDADSERIIIGMKRIGIDGVVVYDPRFTQHEVARLEVIAEDEQHLLLTGGSNGRIAAGALAVDKTTFRKFCRKMNIQPERQTEGLSLG
ncbi:nucleoside-diphosphate kinase [Cohnella massiliensis]|uniref:nucleoside-diphosphate kinase n=1 Tax=Cohnella massiliensis TaxID=1816691 RepID=UPI0009B99264|nr:nucleoside-diphosphate kinase [Cohnella massiliensis]